MKKFTALLLCILYFFSTNICFAFSELNYLKNIDKSVLIPQVESVLAENSYEIKKKNSPASL